MRHLLKLLGLIVLLLALPLHAERVPHDQPVLLVAHPDMQDPNFAQSVVLVLFPPHGGPTGVILNRPTRLKWAEAMPEHPGLAQRSDPIHFGGPVQLNSLWFLFRQAEPPSNALPVVDDLYLAADATTLDGLLAGGSRIERFFVGYAGWASAQLDFEVAEGAWYVLPADLRSILELPADSMWRTLLARATAVEA